MNSKPKQLYEKENIKIQDCINLYEKSEKMSKAKQMTFKSFKNEISKLKKYLSNVENLLKSNVLISFQ